MSVVCRMWIRSLSADITRVSSHLAERKTLYHVRRYQTATGSVNFSMYMWTEELANLYYHVSRIPSESSAVNSQLWGRLNRIGAKGQLSQSPQQQWQLQNQTLHFAIDHRTVPLPSNRRSFLLWQVPNHICNMPCSGDYPGYDTADATTDVLEKAFCTAIVILEDKPV